MHARFIRCLSLTSSSSALGSIVREAAAFFMLLKRPDAHLGHDDALVVSVLSF